MIQLVHPGFLLFGPVLLLPYLVRSQRSWYYSSLQLLPTGRTLGTGVWLTAGLTVAAFALLLIALARPQWTSSSMQHTVQARDIILTLDLSLSMEGHIPSHRAATKSVRKLEVIRDAALTFVERHPDDRLGLVVFGDEAFGAWPLSMDSTTLHRRLRQLDSLLPAVLRGTHVTKALTTTLDHMQQLGQARTTIVLLLTDGLDTISPESQERLLQRLRQQGVRLYVLGIQLPSNASLIQLTRQAQGHYYDVQQVEELEAALRDIEQQEKSTVSITQATTSKELYHVFAWPGLAFLLGALICKTFWVQEV